MRPPRILLTLLFAATAVTAYADGPRDNIPTNVRQIPRLGLEVTAAQKGEFERRLAALKRDIDHLKTHTDRFTLDHIPDVEIFYRAVRTNLDHREFFSRADVFRAAELTNVGRERARQLENGKAPWMHKTGLVVCGFRSKIDNTVQPYGLVIPESYSHKSARGYRLDVWFHGRGETLSETNFISQRMKSVGRIEPKDTIVLHPYGRYSNAFKFAGEVDVLEALADVQRRFRVDEDRISVRGFSMGGAGCWQFAVHYSDRWFAANPGAGFSETPEFLKYFQKETLRPSRHEKTLWQLYDCPGYAINLYHCPTIAYSGELDTQKQAADVMQTAMKNVGLDLLHIVGPDTRHSIHPDSLKEIEERMASLARAGRDRNPKTIKFATYTLKYHKMHWLSLDGLDEHWKLAKVLAQVQPNNQISIKCENVRALTIDMPSGSRLLDVRQEVAVNINGTTVRCPRPKSDRSFRVRLYRSRRGNTWRLGSQRYWQMAFNPDGAKVDRTFGDKMRILRKHHDLQGPIDDAFMDSFVIVQPSSRAANRAVSRWTRSELKHAVKHWRQQFRGDARVKFPHELSWSDIATSNLILFGDPSSNPVIAKIADKLPIKWTARSITVGSRTYDASTHALVMIYPNPINPAKYIVLNSGFTYREYAYLNNARQVPKLPDWAVIDLRTPAGSRFPGRVVEADFFDERWRLKNRGFGFPRRR